MQKLEQRKRLLEAELNQIESGLNDSIHETKESVIEALIPRKAIRKSPIKAVAISVLAGFVIGLPKRRKRSTGKRIESKGKTSVRSPGVATLILDELKRIAARRAVQFMVDTFDEKIGSQKGGSRN
ncbi:MAG: hypothetical protein WD355_10775 [Balneolaceae bacterium]